MLLNCYKIFALHHKVKIHAKCIQQASSGLGIKNKQIVCVSLAIRATPSLSFAKLRMFIMMYIFCYQINKYIKWKGRAQLAQL